MAEFRRGLRKYAS